MSGWRFKKFILIVSFAILICCCGVVNAYVLQGSHILKLMIEKIGKASTLLVSQQLVFYDNNAQEHKTQLNEILRYSFPEKFRSDIVSESVQKICVLSLGNTLTVIDGNIEAFGEINFGRYKDILLYRSVMLLQQKLLVCGIDSSISSFGRFQGMPVYVIGAIYPNESISQILINKNTFLPICYKINNQFDATIFEIQYHNWRQFENIWYPMRIEFHQNGSLIREINVDNVVVNSVFDEEIFNIERIKKNYITDDHNQYKQDETNEIQKTIEEFKKVYE